VIGNHLTGDEDPPKDRKFDIYTSPRREFAIELRARERVWGLRVNRESQKVDLANSAARKEKADLIKKSDAKVDALQIQLADVTARLALSQTELVTHDEQLKAKNEEVSSSLHGHLSVSGTKTDVIT